MRLVRLLRFSSSKACKLTVPVQFWFKAHISFDPPPMTRTRKPSTLKAMRPSPSPSPSSRQQSCALSPGTEPRFPSYRAMAICSSSPSKALQSTSSLTLDLGPGPTVCLRSRATMMQARMLGLVCKFGSAPYPTVYRMLILSRCSCRQDRDAQPGFACGQQPRPLR